MENVEFILDRLLNFYKVSNVAELSTKINTSQKTISNWKIRNSINAIKKRCRELGIYNEIFGDLNGTINISSELNQALKDMSKIDIDETTLFLFKEAYQKAKDNNNLKGLRVYLMDFDQEPKVVDTITLNDFKNILNETLKNTKKK
ncbi:helix-turn-helix domain-containing protein [Aliarcobacter butzleri]|uniref:Bacteriophage CI repressor N-terminal domain-containing protein n=1 Tax=Aliarcobacter butzleri TaxID=28197 RepID=A0AAW6VHU6_9BACT|nr:helix-turn-helix domain-containing protein [Aliarcobacter butzleri]MDK2042059.1 hypothetical protein [Aliarcobacter butzleri]MDK2097278.1 hypothetical protein [Aliarcobacter butzleri]